MRTRSILAVVFGFTLVVTACASAEVTNSAIDAGSDSSEQATSSEEAEQSNETEPAEPEPVESESAESEPEPVESEPVDSEEPAESEPADSEEPVESADETTVGSGADGCGSGVLPGTTSQILDFGGQERTFQQLVPTGYDDATAVPVVLNWHGLGSNGAEQLAFSNYGAVADAENFIVIAPTGLPTPGDDRNSWEVSNDQDPDRDDVAFANALLDTVIASLCVDQTRVYSTGMSNGGFFTSVLVCEMSDRIAAAASIAGLTHSDDCEPENFVPFIAFHGVEDDVVPYNGGGESSLAPGQTLDLFLLEILDEFTEFADDAGCDIEPEPSTESENVIAYMFQGCSDDDSTLTLYEIANAGHTWPGSPISLLISEASGLGVTTTEIDATQVSWDFFSQHSLDS